MLQFQKLEKEFTNLIFQYKHPICKHIAKASQAIATPKALSKSLQSHPREEFQNFSPTLKRKKLKHANTLATQTEKKNETVI